MELLWTARLSLWYSLKRVPVDWKCKLVVCTSGGGREGGGGGTFWTTDVIFRIWGDAWCNG